MKKSIVTFCLLFFVNVMFSQQTIKNIAYIDFTMGLSIYFSPVGITKVTDKKGFTYGHLSIGNTYFFNPRWGIDAQYSFNRFFAEENLSEEIFGGTGNFPLYNGEYGDTTPNNTFNMLSLGPVYRKAFNNKISIQANLNMGLFSLSSENYRAAEKIRGSNNVNYKEIIVPHTYSFVIHPSFQMNYTANKVELYAKLSYVQPLSQIKTTTIDSDLLGYYYKEQTQQNPFRALMLTIGIAFILKKAK